MNAVDLLLFSPGSKEAPAIPGDLLVLEDAFALALPQDLAEVLLRSNGLAAVINGVLIYLWSSGEILNLNRKYRIDKYLPRFIAIGSNGGPRCLCLDYRREEQEPSLVSVPFGDLDIASVKFLGNSLTQFVERVHRMDITNDDIEDNL